MKKNARIILSARRVTALDDDAASAALARIALLFGADYAASLNKKNPRARSDSLAGALLLADMAQTLGVGGKVIRNKCEKPYFEQGGAYFSISHDGGFVVCALSVESEIGVDLTRLPRGLDADTRRRLAARCFTPDEAKNVADTDDEELFARLWARREAVGKLEGSGVTPFFAKPIPTDKYTFEEFYLFDGGKCGLIALCHAQADGVELLALDEGVRIERK